VEAKKFGVKVMTGAGLGPFDLGAVEIRAGFFDGGAGEGRRMVGNSATLARKAGDGNKGGCTLARLKNSLLTRGFIYLLISA
jgi:hypothetical protein